MLINFSVGNFRSFRNLNTLSLESSGSENKPHNFVTIFGPNASGKSNMLKAFEYFRFAIQNTDAINKLTLTHPLLQPFLLNEQHPEKSSFFEMTLCDKDSDIQYRYGFEISSQKVESEWLIETAKRRKNSSERELFLRTDKGLKFDRSVSKDVQKFKNNVHDNILALPFLVNTANYDAASRFTELVTTKFVLFDGSNIDAINAVAFKRLVSDPKLRQRVAKIIQLLDVGVKNFTIEQNHLTDEQMDSDPILKQLKALLAQDQEKKKLLGTTIQTIHNTYDDAGNVVGERLFDLATQESLGTQKLVPFTTMLVDAMDQGLTLIVDEFGSSFHPFIVAALANTFIDTKHDAQVVAFTHEIYLLGQNVNLSREQIWFTEKNRREESKLTSLAEYKPRGDARIDKQYLEGRFGAVPVIFGLKD